MTDARVEAGQRSPDQIRAMALLEASLIVALVAKDAERFAEPFSQASASTCEEILTRLEEAAKPWTLTLPTDMSEPETLDTMRTGSLLELAFDERDTLRAQLDAAEADAAALRAALTLCADTMRDFGLALPLLGHHTMAQACQIVERSARAALAAPAPSAREDKAKQPTHGGRSDG